MNRQSLYLVIAISLTVGIIHFIPHLLMISGSPGRVHLPFSFAETLYAAQVKELLEGHLSIGDPQLYEHKQTFPSVFPYISVAVLGLVSFLSGSVVNGFYLSDFLFPSLLCFTLILFIHSLFRRLDIAIVVSLFVLIMYPFVLRFPPLSFAGFPKYFKELLLIDIQDRLPFYRTPNPQISLLFLTLALLTLWKLWENNQRKMLVLAIITGSALYSVYFYHAVYYLFIVGILWLFAVIHKQYLFLKNISLLLGVLVTIGFIYFMVTKELAYRDLAITGGRFDIRYIDWLYTIRYGVVALGVWIFLRHFSQKVFYFLWSLPIAGIASMNFQLFSGWTMQPGHFPQTTIEPFMTVLVGIGVIHKLTLWKKKNILVITMFALLLYAILTQSLQVERYRNTWTVSQDFARALDWLKTHTDKETVVVSLDPGVLAYIPVMTPANIFLPVEEYHYAKIDEIWQRILYAHKLYEVPVDHFDPTKLGIPILFELTYNVNQYKYLDLGQYSSDMQQLIRTCYPSLCSGLYALPDSLTKKIKHSYSQTDISKNPFRVDYLVYSPAEQTMTARKPAGTLVFHSGDYEIYDLN